MKRPSIPVLFLLGLNVIAPFAVWLYIASGFMIAPYPYPAFSGPVAEHIALRRPDRFNLALISDVHNNAAGFKTVMDDAAARHADAALVLGDFTHRGLLVEKRLFINQVIDENWPVPLYTVIGNHDLDYAREPEFGHDYRAVFGDDHFRWRFGESLFIAVNNVERTVREDEYKWIVETAEREGRPGGSIYLLMHKPPFNDDDGALAWEKRFAKYAGAVQARGLKAIFCGHLHRSEEHEIDGVKIFVVSNIGDFDDKGKTILLQYLILNCDHAECTVSHVKLGNQVHRTTVLHRLLVNYYWGWLVWSGLAAALLAVFIFKRTRNTADAASRNA